MDVIFSNFEYNLSIFYYLTMLIALFSEKKVVLIFTDQV